MKAFKINYGDHFKKNSIQVYLKIFNLIKVFYVKWPILRVYLSLEPVKFIMGAKEIENYLIQNNFILTQKHATNSAWAKQGEEYL